MRPRPWSGWCRPTSWAWRRAAGATRSSPTTTGGILDDLIVSNAGDHLFLVVNAGCRDADLAHLRAGLEPAIRVTELADRALLALQGPAAVDGAGPPGARPAPSCRSWARPRWTVDGLPCRVSRLGYTGEDGYEISVAAGDAERLARTLLGHDEVRPAGLGARDSLRLEAGLPLYGHDIDTTTSPVEAGLAWSIAKRRRAEGGFAGAAVIQRQLAEGAARKLVGLKPDGKAPAREGTEIQTPDGRTVGTVTSGGFGPTVGGPVAMGYVETALAAPGTELVLLVRGKPLPARVVRPALRPPPLPPLSRRPAMADLLHQGPRMGPHRRRHRHRRHQPSTPRSSWATSCSSSCPTIGRSVAKGEQAAVVESVKAASEIYAPIGGEVTEGNAGAGRGPGPGQPRRRGRRLVLQAAGRGCRRELEGLMDRAAYDAYLESIA